MKYHTILADPPWAEYGGGKIKRGADRHYPLMTTREILALSSLVKSLADTNCHLYLWATNNHLPDALEVVKAWGFDYKTLITWAKPRFGLGQYFRGMTEHCIFAVKGTLPYKTRPDGLRAQGRTLITAERGAHSEKPQALMDMVELVSHPPYLEMFARSQRLGWDVWENGNLIKSS